MSDPYASHESGLTSPARNAAAVTPSDTENLTTSVRALYIGGGSGVLKVDTVGGQTVTFAGVPVGFVLPVSVQRVYVTGTTATNIVGIW
jgi:hypothetical protein